MTNWPKPDSHFLVDSRGCGGRSPPLSQEPFAYHTRTTHLFCAVFCMRLDTELLSLFVFCEDMRKSSSSSWSPTFRAKKQFLNHLSRPTCKLCVVSEQSILESLPSPQYPPRMGAWKGACELQGACEKNAPPARPARNRDGKKTSIYIWHFSFPSGFFLWRRFVKKSVERTTWFIFIINVCEILWP